MVGVEAGDKRHPVRDTEHERLTLRSGPVGGTGEDLSLGARSFINMPVPCSPEI